jgi:zinc/manganese transport system permease protein
MIDILTFMAPAICISLILAGICGYVGIHVIMREVIFIDIALAQIAAFGTSICVLYGMELNDPYTFIISLGFTLLAAFLLSGTRTLSRIVPQEAFIGILYATGAAAIILTGDRIAHGSEHVKELMTGHLLWANWNEVGFYSAVYLILGIIYFIIHKKLVALSKMKKNNSSQGNKVVLWEFIFYSLLGILVTFAVRIAGVLLVFGFLVVPAVIGFLLGKSFVNRLIYGWITGFLVSLIGSYLSYELDFPTGATIVVTLGIALFIVALIKSTFIKIKTPKIIAEASDGGDSK